MATRGPSGAVQPRPPKGEARVGRELPTQEEFERLAAAFRPLWEIDDAPSAGVETSDIRALQSFAPGPESPPRTPPEVSGTHVAPRPPSAPPVRPDVSAVDTGSVSYVRPSRKPLWISAGVLILALGGAGVWATAGGHPKPAPALEATARPVDTARVSAIPPPPPETQAAPPPAVRAVSAPPSRPPEKPAAKKGPSIVRDVPF